MKASKNNWKTFTIQSCKRLIKALLKEETVDSNTVKANNKAMLDQVPIKSIEHFDFFNLTFSILFKLLLYNFSGLIFAHSFSSSKSRK
jgi:hypothetical protein